MRRRKLGGIAAFGLLCAVAGTVAVWSGPLAAATSGFHGSSPTPVVAHAAPAHATR